MYNFSMKSEEKCSLVKKFKDYILLVISIILLFSIVRYSYSKGEYEVYINDVKQDLTCSVYSENNEQYICLEDMTNIFKDNIYYDKISGKIIITKFDNILKLNKNDKNYLVLVNEREYINLNKIVSNLGYDMYVQNSNIHIIHTRYVKGNITKNRTEIFDKTCNQILLYANKQDETKVLVNDLEQYEDSKIIDVVVTQNNNKYYGYVLKDNVKFEYVKEKIEERKKEIIVRAEDLVKDTTDMKYVSKVVLDMIRLSSVNGISELDYDINDVDISKIYAGFNLSQKASNYDSDIFTNMVNSETNRELVISKTIDYIIRNKLLGVCVDFSNFKVSDKGNYVQFIKELAASLHKNGKEIIVNLPSIEYLILLDYIDYGIINAYNEKSISSKISGPISSINYVENVIKQTLNNNKNVDRVIIEIPTYSVLWTERKGTVINAEIYSMKLQKEYIKANNLKTTKDKKSNQNLINYTKGITTFKMWLEDNESILRKAELVKEYNLAGISLYKSGMEEKEIYVTLFNTFSK